MVALFCKEEGFILCHLVVIEQDKMKSSTL